MADLTPPSSKQNTPLRPLQPSAEPPSSPITTDKPSTSAHPLASNTMEVDASATSGSEEMVDAHEVEMGGEEVSEEEEEEFVEAEEGGGPEKEEILEGGMTEAIDGVERSSGTARKSKSRAKSRQQPKRAAGKAPEVGGLGKMKGRKDGDLYESEIVARWNSEIGDVCLDNAAPTSTIAAW